MPDPRTQEGARWCTYCAASVPESEVIEYGTTPRHSVCGGVVSATDEEFASRHASLTALKTNPEARPGAEVLCDNCGLFGPDHVDIHGCLNASRDRIEELESQATYHAQQLAALQEDAKRLDWLTYYNMDRISRTSVEPQFIAWNRDHESAFKDSIREAIDFARSANDGGVG